MLQLEPLHCAVFYGRDAMVGPLVARSSSNMSIEYRLWKSVDDDNHRSVEALLQDAAANDLARRREWRSGEAPLHCAAYHGRDALVGTLVAAGVHVDSIVVCENGDRSQTERLVEVLRREDLRKKEQLGSSAA
jgi:ankyrin repeat protein